MTARGEEYVKRRCDAPAGFFEVEAAGLDWLAAAEADGGVRVARVRSVHPGRLVLERVATRTPTPAPLPVRDEVVQIVRPAHGQLAGEDRRSDQHAAAGVVAGGRCQDGCEHGDPCRRQRVTRADQRPRSTPELHRPILGPRNAPHQDA